MITPALSFITKELRTCLEWKAVIFSLACFKISISSESTSFKALSISSFVTSRTSSTAPSNFLLYSTSALSPFSRTFFIISVTIPSTSIVCSLLSRISSVEISLRLYILITVFPSRFYLKIV